MRVFKYLLVGALAFFTTSGVAYRNAPCCAVAPPLEASR
jgi:hypothetical protein